MKDNVHVLSTKRQSGAAVLVIAVVLLVAVTLAVLFTASTAVLETRMSANEVRSKQAHAAAQAGIDQALAEFNANGVPLDETTGAPTMDPLDSEDLLDPTKDPNNGRITGRYTVRFCAIDATLAQDCTCDAPPAGRFARIYSCGWSEDDSAVQRLSVAVAAPAAIPPGGPPDAPLISRGSTDLLTGNATVINWYTNTTVWTGDDTTGQSATSTTLIRNPLNPNPVNGNAPDFGNAQCNNPPTGYICTSRGASFGPDVISNDITLASLGDADYFGFFFGFPENGGDALAQYKNSLRATNIDPEGGLTAVEAGQVYYFTADEFPTLSLTQDLGTPDNPVILIVEGDLSLTGAGGVEVYGIVMALGELTGNANANIHGSMIVGSTNMSGSGNLKIIYDPDVLLKAAEVGGRQGGSLAGTWQDWN